MEVIGHKVDANIPGVIEAHQRIVPNAKLLMIVRNPIVRYISDILHYNVVSGRDAPKYHDIDRVVQGKVETGLYFKYNRKLKKFSTISKIFLQPRQFMSSRWTKATMQKCTIYSGLSIQR